MNKIVKIFLIFFIFLLVDNQAQSIPNSFYLNKSALSKVAVDPTPSGNSVEYIEFMGNDVWVATSVGVSKSTDAGENWTNYNFGNEGISALGFKNDTVWVATWHSEEIDGSDIAVGSGLHYSSDMGETWIDIPQPIDEENDTTIVYGINTLNALPVTAVEQNFTRDIAFTKNTIWITSFAGGLRRSDDIGKTWTRVVLPPDSLDEISPNDSLDFDLSPSSGKLGYQESLNHRLFSVKAVDDSTIIVGSANGINLSKDGGISWKKFNRLNQSNPISGNFILDINYDYSRNTIWASTWKAEGQTEFYGVSSSSDFGENWKTYLPGENTHDIAFTYNEDGTENDILIASDNGIFRSNDLGESWLLAPEMIDDESKIPLTSNNFRAVNCLIENGINNLWFGGLSGTATLKETGNMWDGEWSVFISSPETSSSSSAIAFPNPFSPDSEPVKIKYNFEGDSKSITIRIFDFGMNLVKTVVQNLDREGGREYFDNWDGRDENNEFVPNGVYFYRIDLGNDEPLYGKILVVM